MSTDTIINEALDTPPKPKRVYRTKRRHKRRPKDAAAPAPKPSTDLAGLAPQDCPKACTAERCVISGRFYCAHPRKGGLQGVDMNNPEALARLHQAQKVLARRKLD